MEECLGVNGRQLLVRVDFNLEECENVLLVQCFIIIIQHVLWHTMQFPQWTNNVVLYLSSIEPVVTIFKVRAKETLYKSVSFPNPQLDHGSMAYCLDLPDRTGTKTIKLKARILSD